MSQQEVKDVLRMLNRLSSKMDDLSKELKEIREVNNNCF